MNIALITHSYPPEIRSSSHLMLELAQWLKSKGYNVTVVTAFPKYNMEVKTSTEGIKEYTDEDGIKVIRVKTLPIHDANFIVRGIAQLTMSYPFMRKIKKYILKEIDVAIVYSPPITLAQVGATLYKRYKKKVILNVQDLFPQNAIDLGILNNKLLIKLFECIEKKAYAGASKILVHSEGNKKFLISNKQVDPKKIDILHNWVDIDAFERVTTTGKFRKSYGLDNKFVFLFAGILGPSQGLDFIVKLANKIKSKNGIRFLFVGDGIEKERLNEMIKSYELNNIVFAPFVSRDEYPELVKEMDVGLVCLSNMNKTPVMPSKILGYMAGGIPVLSFLHKESDGHDIIKEARCGYSMVYGDIEKATNVVNKLYEEKDNLKSMGNNGKMYISKHLSLDNIMSNLEQHIVS